jgi:polysaccharide pyruvyl transferase WcaK-like protein
MCDASVTVLPHSRGRHFDLIVHGGGGTYFDFAEGSSLDALLNRFVLSGGGALYRRVDGWARALAARPRDSAKVRIGWGLGIGTFTRSSRQLRHKLPTLLDFDGLMVRDEQSIRNLDRLGVSVPAERGTDIAFLHDLWTSPLQNGAREPREARRARVGVVLRDWPDDQAPPHGRCVVDAAPALARRYDLTFVSFDATADVRTASLTRPWPRVAWDPHESSISEFSSTLRQFDVLISSRAHGAICGAVLDVPSVLIEIEPKMRAVHDMLPRSTRLAPARPSSEELMEAVQELLALDPSVVASEVAANRAVAARSVARLLALAKGAVDA